MKTYRATVRRVERTEVAYATGIGGLQADSEAEALRKAEAVLHRLPGVEEEGWSEGDAETTLSPPEIVDVEVEAEDAAWLAQVAATAPRHEVGAHGGDST